MKKAFVEAMFRKIDLDYLVHFAEIAKTNGIEQFVLISALGANSKSGNFYLKTKGEIEDALVKLNFHSLIILRPSILLGPRAEFRPAELIAKFFMRALGFLFIGPLKKYKGVHAQKVGRAMVHFAKQNLNGVRIVESDEINESAFGGEVIRH